MLIVLKCANLPSSTQLAHSNALKWDSAKMLCNILLDSVSAADGRLPVFSLPPSVLPAARAAIMAGWQPKVAEGYPFLTCGPQKFSV
jgi:hypothetical protein